MLVLWLYLKYFDSIALTKEKSVANKLIVRKRFIVHSWYSKYQCNSINIYTFCSQSETDGRSHQYEKSAN